MEFNLLFIFIFLNLALFGGRHVDAALPAEVYWKSVFPHTPMPKTFEDLLSPPPGNKMSLIDTMKDDSEINDGDYGSGDPSMEFKRGNGNSSPTNKTTYFLEKELHPGKKMILPQLTMASNGATFLSRQVADSTPFSRDKFHEILNHFSLEPQSSEAKAMRRTLANCERPAIRGEDKRCATSLESMVDFGVSKLGKNVRILSSESVEGKGTSQEFTIGNEGAKKLGEKEVVCHKMKYPYAVFFCHSLDKTAVYEVPLVGEDGKKAKGIAVCHKDTSAWNPKHKAFWVLKVEPGTVPVCHFLMRENLVWVPI